MSLKVCKMRFLAVFEPLLQVKAYSCGQKNSRTTARQNPWVGEFILWTHMKMSHLNQQDSYVFIKVMK